jgi:hypothetical protein
VDIDRQRPGAENLSAKDSSWSRSQDCPIFSTATA